MKLSVKAWRQARSMSQEDMSKRLNVHINTYQKWEKAPDTISVRNARNISNILEVPIDDIDFFKVD